MFGKTVHMKSGAYLVIEHTEALHVFDVNSGNRAKSEQTQEQNALEVNLDAAAEVARQLDRKSTRLNSSHSQQSRMPSSA